MQEQGTVPFTVSQHKHLETKGACAQKLGVLIRESRAGVPCTENNYLFAPPAVSAVFSGSNLCLLT